MLGTLLNNYLLKHHQVDVFHVDEGFLEESDMSGTHLNGFLLGN